MTKRLKVLMCSEASFLKSGFGTYANEILSRLHNTNKYEIAEFASYGKVNDPNDASIKWRYYANAVNSNDPRHKEYMSSMDNQFGRWRFERVLLDFKPDVVIDVRDYWMTSYQHMSPLRPYYHWVLMPTVDSFPQQEEWIDTFVHADAVFAYSEFGRDVLYKQSNNHIKFVDTASPGVDLSIFNIKNQQKARENLGVPPNAYVIGSIMRNQKRKLIPELFQTIRSLIDTCKNSEYDSLGKNIFLYLHTSYPDAGWDIPEILKYYKIGNRVLFSYYCHNCNAVTASLFSHPIQFCKKCGKKSSIMPSVSKGVSQYQLSDIINTFDLYVQYAICEGFGMPQVEAGACGVPIASTDYSAMSDVVRKLNGYPIKIGQYFKEMETKSIRVYPDNQSLMDNILSHYKLSDENKQLKRIETRKLTEQYFNWDNIAKKWENYLDNVVLTGMQGKWNEKLESIKNIPMSPERPKNNYLWMLDNINQHMSTHTLSSSIIPLYMIRNMDYEFVSNGANHRPYTYQNATDELNTIINNVNLIAKAQNRPDALVQEDYIQYANMKDSIK